MTTLSVFDDLIASRSLLQHPFYVKWSKGELTMDDMNVYAKEYFHLAKRIPGIVERVKIRATEQSPEMLAMIQENMEEEQEHVELWKRFANSLGISNEELEAYQPSETVQAAVNALEEVAEGTFEDGIAAMYALEKELPEIAATKKEGLSKFYGLNSEDAHIYFDEHLKEEKHINVWLSVQVDDAQAESAVRKSLEAQNKVLDAVCEVAGIDCNCDM